MTPKPAPYVTSLPNDFKYESQTSTVVAPMSIKRSSDNFESSRQRVRDVKSRCRIEDVAAHYSEVKRSGSQRFVCRCLCGENSDRRPSLMLYANDNGFHCFACDRHGSVIDLVMLASKCDFRTALKLLRQDDIGASATMRPVQRPQQQQRTVRPLSDLDRQLLNATVELYHKQLFEHSEHLHYLTDMRGLTLETIRRLKLGYSDGHQLIRRIHSHGLSLPRLMEIGLITPKFKEMLRQRITFPVWRGNDVVYIIGRATQPWQADVKYLGLNDDVVTKQPMVAGVARRGSIIVEGAVDFALLLQWGLDSDYLLIGLLGTAFEVMLAQVIAQMSPVVYICTDQDWAGKQTALKLAVALKKRGIQPRVFADADRHQRVGAWVTRTQEKSELSEQERDKLPKGQAEMKTVRALIKQDCVQWVHWNSRAKDPGDLGARGEEGKQVFLTALDEMGTKSARPS